MYIAGLQLASKNLQIGICLRLADSILPCILQIVNAFANNFYADFCGFNTASVYPCLR